MLAETIVIAALATSLVVAAVFAWRKRSSELDAARADEAGASADAEALRAELATLAEKFTHALSDFEWKSNALTQEIQTSAMLRETIIDLEWKLAELTSQNSDLAGQLAGARARAKRKEKGAASQAAERPRPAANEFITPVALPPRHNVTDELF